MARGAAARYTLYVLSSRMRLLASRLSFVCLPLRLYFSPLLLIYLARSLATLLRRDRERAEGEDREEEERVHRRRIWTEH